MKGEGGDLGSLGKIYVGQSDILGEKFQKSRKISGTEQPRNF
jgi:hypothetical protein